MNTTASTIPSYIPGRNIAYTAAEIAKSNRARINGARGRGWRKQEDHKYAAEHGGYTPKYPVHEHPITWNIERQVWVCKDGCGFEREKREGEVCPERGYGDEYAPMVGRLDRVVNFQRPEDY